MKKKKKDGSKPLPDLKHRHTMKPSESDISVMKHFGISERLRGDEVYVIENDITALRIYFLMNDYWDVYSEVCKKIPKLKELNDVVILEKLKNSLKKYGWLSGHVQVTQDNKLADGRWYILDGRHRFAVAYALGIDFYIKPRLWQPSYQELRVYTMPIFKHLNSKHVEALQRRYRVQCLLSRIPIKRNGKNRLYSSCQKINEFGIQGQLDIKEFIARHHDIIAGKRILEIGSEEGVLACSIRDLSSHCVTVEPDVHYREITELTKKQFEKDFTVLENLTKLNEKFDVVICSTQFASVANNYLSGGGSLLIKYED